MSLTRATSLVRISSPVTDTIPWEPDPRTDAFAKEMAALCDGPQALYTRDFAGFAERVAAHAVLTGRRLA